MSSDDLNAPLGQGKRKAPSKLRAAIPQILVGVLGLVGIAVVAWAIFVNDPLGGEPTAVVATGPQIKKSAKPEGEGPQHSGRNGPSSDTAPPVSVAIPAAAPPSPPPGSKTITIIDGSSGKHENVTVPGRSSGNSSTAPVDQRLLAPVRAVDPGLGRSIRGGLVERARTEDHEVLLQAPMEPFDYPDNDPGPQTLLTSLTPDQNIDRLHWQMSRFQGYVGILSYMGARFTGPNRRWRRCCARPPSAG